jgi:hypothetical protein
LNRFVFIAAIVFLGTEAAQTSGIVIVQKVESAGQAGEITLQLDGSKARADLSPTVSVIIDSETGEQVALMHRDRKFMRLTAAEGEKLTNAVKKDPAIQNRPSEEIQPELKKTGRTATVAGQKTEIYKYETGTLKATYWIAGDFPDAATILKNLEILQKSKASGIFKDRMPAPAHFPGLPVKTEIVIGDRKVTSTLISIVKRKIDPSVFEIPEEYISAYIGGGIPGITPGVKKPFLRNPGDAP